MAKDVTKDGVHCCNLIIIKSGVVFKNQLYFHYDKIELEKFVKSEFIRMWMLLDTTFLHYDNEFTEMIMDQGTLICENGLAMYITWPTQIRRVTYENVSTN